MSIEQTLGEYLELAKMKPLSGQKLERAKELMRKLREAGFTNQEISQLTSGGWSEPTIKLYTRGTTVKNPSGRKALELLAEQTARGMTLEDVERVLSLKTSLETKGLSFEEVSSLVDEIKGSG